MKDQIGHVVVQTVNFRFLAWKTSVQSQDSACGICGELAALGQVLPGTSVVLYELLFHQCSVFISHYTGLM
jgi:hypothetical protein